MICSELAISDGNVLLVRLIDAPDEAADHAIVAALLLHLVVQLVHLPPVRLVQLGKVTIKQASKWLTST